MFASTSAVEGDDEIAGMAEEGVQETVRYADPVTTFLSRILCPTNSWTVCMQHAQIFWLGYSRSRYSR